MYKKPKSKGGRKYQYSTTLMRQVVHDVNTNGLSYSEAIKKYNLSNTTSMIQGWCRKFGSEIQLVEIDIEPTGELKMDRIKDLEKALEAANLKIISLETLIDVAEEELNIEIRKKSGSKQ